MVNASNWYSVHNINTGLDYTTIQAAIDAPETLSGHTIFAEEGVYYEHVVVNKSISLIGEKKYTTIIDGNGTGYVVTVTSDHVIVTGFSIQGGGSIYPDYGCCVYLESDDIIINQNILRNAGSGVLVYRHHRNIISQNIVTNTTLCGIAIDGSTNHKIVENNITYAQFPAIYAKRSGENEFRSNFLANNSGGIYLGYCSNNYVVENTIFNSWVGIILDLSSYNSVKGNRVFGNTLGLGLDYLAHSLPSHHNVIVENDFTNNEKGVHTFLSSDNLLCRNNFINNTYQFYNHLSTNVWDDGLEGNYWSSYSGVDLNHDGIGDTSHIVDEDNIDRYPLMGMFHSFNTSVGKYVNVVSNSTIEDFEYFESNNTLIMHVSSMTSNQTFGFNRICIPHALINETYHITINGAEPYYVNYALYDNSTHRWIYFNYEHSILEIIIIPECPSLIILSLFMMATLLAVIVYRRKHQTS
jgi:nitrous oxidase accessory protein